MVAVLALSLSGALVLEASELCGVVEQPRAPARATRTRWRSWWCADLFQQPWFAVMSAQLGTPVEGYGCPDTLLSRFTGCLPEQVVHLFAWLAPSTTRSLSVERARIAMAL